MSLKGNAIANYLGQGWTILMGFAFIPVYIRFLGLEAYGLIGVFALLQAWLSLLDVGLTVAILARVSPSIEAFFLWQGLVSTVTIAVFASLVRGSLPPIDRRPRFSLATLQGVSRFATGTVLVTLLGFLLSQSDKLILSSLLSLEHFALYSLAYTVASAVRQLAQPIDQAAHPGMTLLYQQGDEA